MPAPLTELVPALKAELANAKARARQAAARAILLELFPKRLQQDLVASIQRQLDTGDLARVWVQAVAEATARGLLDEEINIGAITTLLIDNSRAASVIARGLIDENIREESYQAGLAEGIERALASLDTLNST